jgi:hypothetical protein
MEKSPWWQNVAGPFPSWQGPQGVNAQGGGNVRGQGRIGRMLIHQAVCNRSQDGAGEAPPPPLCPSAVSERQAAP